MKKTEDASEMPAAYAHDRFGCEVLKALPADVKTMVEKNMKLFFIGLQGPDPFYYYNPLKKTEIYALAENLHNMSGYALFTKIAPRSDAEAAYLAGFLCHFTLDASCHWYVNQYMKAKNVTHDEIEGEFDRFLLVKDGADPLRAVKTKNFHPENVSAQVICHFFRSFYGENVSSELTVPKVRKSLNGFVRFEGILRCPSDLKRNTLYWLLKRVGQYDSLKGHITSKEPDPACRESNEGLFSLYSQAVPDAVDLVTDFLRKDLVNFGQNPLLTYNFLGEKVIMNS